MIKGTTLIKREVFNFPGGQVKIGTIDADVEITASEHIYQWLHLVDGGWVSAGARQQYVKWQVVPDDYEEPEPSAPEPGTPEPGAPAPSPTSPAPVEDSTITEVKRKGRIATLRVDWQNSKWDYMPRKTGAMLVYPHTVTFSPVCEPKKGGRIPLTEPVLEYLERLNGEKIKDRILVPTAGWINHPTIPPTVERLTWAANHVVVKETTFEKDVEYSNVYALNCYATDLEGTFFDKDMRLVVHKFNAVTQNSTLVKLGNGHDCYTPFITNPDTNDGDMWIPSDYLEKWPDLPFRLSDGTRIVEYELYGFEIFGLREDGSSVLLRDPDGFRTNWVINSPEVPY